METKETTKQIIDEMEVIEKLGKVKNTNNGDLNLIIANKTIKTNNNFVILFYESLDYVINNCNLSTVDIRVLLNLLKKASFGNLLKFTQAAIAKDLETSQPAVNRSLKKLKKSGIILETEDGEIYLDPQIIIKGNLGKQKKKDINKELKSKSSFNNY